MWRPLISICLDEWPDLHELGPNRQPRYDVAIQSGFVANADSVWSDNPPCGENNILGHIYLCILKLINCSYIHECIALAFITTMNFFSLSARSKWFQWDQRSNSLDVYPLVYKPDFAPLLFCATLLG